MQVKNGKLEFETINVKETAASRMLRDVDMANDSVFASTQRMTRSNAERSAKEMYRPLRDAYLKGMWG